MQLKLTDIKNSSIAELVSEKIEIATLQDAIDLIGNAHFQGADKIVIHERNLVPEFFDLKTKLAGDILQKISNYRMQLAIVGDFSEYRSKSLADFIMESNKTKRILFLSSREEAFENLIT
jgi:hypothetical protein